MINKNYKFFKPIVFIYTMFWTVSFLSLSLAFFPVAPVSILSIASVLFLAL